MSTRPSEKWPHAPSLVSGVKPEDLDSDPILADYFAANFAPIKIKKVEDVVIETDEERRIREAKEERERLNIGLLYTFKREYDGTRRCDEHRERYHLIPGVLYGPAEASQINRKIGPILRSRIFIHTPMKLLQAQLDRHHRNFEGRVYDLTVFEDPDDEEGIIHRVIPRDVQRHPVQNKVYCVNFLRYFPSRAINIPIVYVNEEESPALKRSGFIIPINRVIECVVEEGARIPDKIEMECTGLRFRDVAKIDRLLFPPGVKPSSRVDQKAFMIGPVHGTKRVDLEEEEEAAAEVPKQQQQQQAAKDKDKDDDEDIKVKDKGGKGKKK